MKPIRTQQRFQCDFCQYRSVKSVVEKHERRCFRNPNRFCDNCDNKGHTEENHGIDEFPNWIKTPCFYCSKFDPQILKEIKERESKI